MTLTQKRLPQVGDEVRWNNPNNALCKGTYWIQDIISDDAPVNGLDLTLVITDGKGNCSEVSLAELN